MIAMRFLLSLVFCIFVHASNYSISGLDSDWQNWNKIHEIIREWSKKQVNKLRIRVQEVIFYPFGGGDISPIYFFPNFSRLIIIGLEPTGNNFSLEDEDGIRENLRFFLRRGFFVTRDMEKFRHSGILTVILLQLDQIGAKNIQYIIGYRHGFKLFTITFDWEEKRREITYIQANLADSNHFNWKILLEEFQKFTLFVKGASFVLQQPGFEKIREFLVARADLVFQDDTGIKYGDLCDLGYKIELFGGYYLRYKIPGLEKFFQEELKEAYEQLPKNVLPFSISYRSHQVEPNMLIAYKNAAKLAENEAIPSDVCEYDSQDLPENLLDE